ncbi:MAG: hypothetical protein GTO62_03230, partial [Planctomycetales bacterium]|nr:hypothetical protein [Planctomycetales bacterium]NIP68231.1 hypothetical protein [Planctomycetales bacterium]
SAPSATGLPPTAGTFNPTRIDLGDVFGRTWEIFKREWGKCLVALLL